MRKSDTPFLDRVILHNKNADERLFDMILRFITFVVLIIIIWIYADLVHAKADGINVTGCTCDFISFQEWTTLTAEEGFLWYDKILDGLEERNIDISNGIPQGQFQSSYNNLIQSQSYITPEFLNSLPIPTNINAQNVDCGNAYRFDLNNVNVEDNGVYLYLTEASANYFNYYIIYTWPEEQWLYGYDTMLRNYAENYNYSNFYANKYLIWVSYDVQNNTWSAGLQGSGYGQSESNCPLFSNQKVWYAYGGANMVKNAEFEEVESPVNQQVLNLNYVEYNNLIGSNTLKESNKNHLYFKDVQIGLSSGSSNMDLLGSSVVIGVDVDDWVKNHINDYWVYVSYRIHIKDSDVTVADPSSAYGQYLPLRTFMNDVYTYSIADLFENLPVNQYGNFMSYYNHIRSSKSIKVTNHNGRWNHNGIFPSALRFIGYEISDYAIEEVQIPNYSIFDFGLEVRIVLTDNQNIGSSDTSGVFSKDFDFLHGSSSITKADGLYNANPWEGETNPNDPNNINPNVPSGSISGDGSGASAVAYGGNVNVTINNNNKLVGNGAEGNDTESIIDKYNEIFGTFKSSFGELATVGSSQGNNGFMGFLSSTYSFIPGLNYIVICVGVVFSLIIVLVVIRALLF